MYVQNSSHDILLNITYAETRFPVDLFSSEVQEHHIRKDEIIHTTHS